MYDFIVVGGGSSGCVTAGKLVAEHGARVLLIEAGWPDRNSLIHMPAGYVRLLTRPSKYFVGYDSQPQVSLGGRSVRFLQANVLGGGSSLNAMTYARGTRADYDSWDKALGGAGWSWKDMLPHFIGQEGNQRLGSPLHGTDGPLKVSDAHHPPNEISRAFLLALQAEGIPYTADFNDGDERGGGYIQSTTFRGQRCSAAKAFIEPLRSDPRLTIKFNSPALRLVLEGNRAIGVEHAISGGRGTEVARAANEIILCAGGLISPKLLMLSGIGCASELRTHNISVVSHLPGVGQNLQDHNDTHILVETTANFGYSGEDRGLRMLANGMQYLLFGSGPVASTGSEVTAFLDPVDYSKPPKVQFYCVGAIYDSSSQVSPATGITLSAALVAPKSRGSVTIRSGDPEDPPQIDPNWLSEKEDVTDLVQGLRCLQRVMCRTPLRQNIKRVISPITESSNDAEVEDYCRSVTHTNWHPVGTCRMGRGDDELAVLDPRLRVRGVENLRIFDGSVMPTIISANTNAPIMAIADKGVKLMMEDLA